MIKHFYDDGAIEYRRGTNLPPGATGQHTNGPSVIWFREYCYEVGPGEWKVAPVRGQLEFLNLIELARSREEFIQIVSWIEQGSI